MFFRAASYTELLEVLYGFYAVVMFALCIAIYVIQSLGLYAIAKRRGIGHPWLAWLPVGNLWILGSISDRYRQTVHGQVKNKRKLLLALDACALIGSLVLSVSTAVTLVGMIAGGLGGGAYPFWEQLTVGALLGILFLALVLVGLSVAMAVVQYMALYDLYTSCDPCNSVAYLMLSIFVSAAMPVLVFLCRNKDQGMPENAVPLSEARRDAVLADASWLNN